MSLFSIRYGACLLSLALATPVANAAATDILELDLEELMQVLVTSASKKPQSLAQTAAAVHVISAEDIRRSGAANIPEALRLAPGVQVFAIAHNRWAVSIRGFADRYSNKLLVLVDGRSVYTPLFSGVFWEALNVPLESIARIEVIRGPGAAIWGANAVNGVVNIITKSPKEVQGGQLSLVAGDEYKGDGYARYAWRPGADTAMLVHVNGFEHDASRQVGGGEGVDDWRGGGLGFKLEHDTGDGVLHLQGATSHTEAGIEFTLISAPPAVQAVRTTQEINESHLLARWEQRLDEARSHTLQGYLTHFDYQHLITGDSRTTLDLEYEQRLRLGERHDLVWGVGYRYSRDRVDDTAVLVFDKNTRGTSLYSLFAQDEIVLRPERLHLSLGARLEHNDYTGFSLQPNLRLLWTPNQANAAWLSLAHAVRTPSRIERGGSAYVAADPTGQPLPSVVQLISRDFDDEQVRALDLGWRHRLSPLTSLDLAAFYYRYDDLRGAALTPPQVVPAGYVSVVSGLNNANSADVYGVEASLAWLPRQDWKMQVSYSWLQYRVHTAAIPTQTPSDYRGLAAKHHLSLRSSLQLSERLSWDAWLRHVSAIERYQIPAYTSLDMRLAWQPRKDLEIALVGQNLTDDAHPEYSTQFFVATPSEIERGVYLKVDWRF